VDVRADFPKFKQDAAIADAIGVGTLNLPTRGIGFVAGAHWYPLRFGFMTLGVGGEWVATRRSRTLNTGTEAAPLPVSVTTRFSTLAPQISFNFGSRNGYSYISGGIGPSVWSITPDDGVALAADSERLKTINYGGGARWFIKPHLAFSLDLRFYAINPSSPDPVQGLPAGPRTRLVVIGAGISLK